MIDALIELAVIMAAWALTMVVASLTTVYTLHLVEKFSEYLDRKK